MRRSHARCDVWANERVVFVIICLHLALLPLLYSKQTEIWDPTDLRLSPRLTNPLFPAATITTTCTTYLQLLATLFVPHTPSKMSEFKSALKTFDLEAALATDRGEDCLIIDVGTDKNGHSVASLRHIAEQVDHYVHSARAKTFRTTKLYIIGRWNLTQPGLLSESELEKFVTQVSVPYQVLGPTPTESVA
jgi:hypothetical protein